MPLTAGDPVRVGRYRLLARLGQGGMGRVYLGRSPGGRAVAVKVVRDALLRDEGFRRRFVREVEAARRVTGFFTAAVVDADPEGEPAWLATEYVPGLSLRDAVARHGVWPEEGVRGLGAALAEALAAVHAADLVHRDLKPSNVLLAPDGPRVIDFGISAAAGDTALTQTGVVIGTPGFIPPEQLRHDSSGPAGDVFALGAVLAYAAAGVGPFGSGASHAVNYRVVHEDPDLGGLPPALADVVARCLAKDPAQRPAVAWLLEELGESEPAADGRVRQPVPAPDEDVTTAGWMPGPVADSAARLRAETPTEPLPRPGDGTPQSLPAPSPSSPAVPVPVPVPAPPGTRRRRLRTVLAAATALAVAATGTVLWRVTAGEDGNGPTRPPNLERLWTHTLADGQVLATASEETLYLQHEERHEITALDVTDGSQRWDRRMKVADVRRDKGHLKSPGNDIRVTAVSGGLLYYGSNDHLYAVDANSGDHRWRYMDDSFHASPVVVGDLAYAHMTSFFYVLDTRTGEELWDYGYGVNANGDIAVTGDVLLVHSEKKLIAVDLRTREQKWTHEAASEAATGLAVADGKVYFGTRDGALYAVDTSSGDEVWRRTFEGELWDGRLGGGAGMPEVAGGTVYFENDGYVSAFDAGTGSRRWQRKQRADEVTSLDVVDDTLLVTDSDGGMTALDTRSGRTGWRESPGGGDGTSFRITGEIVVTESAGRLTAYRAAT
ncbi:protein kinase domain-containing protein [Streptomyces lycii]|uniref:PQQ-binding-like beta-propeller repeat protein n=1 Tax=Streptomyces lycii TaxID=2654337 RepID=A0ABQ7FI66_9ACTN|nr:PQQ-binding-like beta-propeller repeat protein [Streptomyces lycii]KAF4407638.1 PQQ-binding-like beta-propeller repeat protein [Streptomyces lycii]